MKKFILLIIVIATSIGLFACNQDSDDRNDKGSYAIIVVIHGNEYNFHSYELDKELVIGSKISTIKRKLAADKYPKELESNFFEEGVELFQINGTDEYIVAIDNTDKGYEQVVLKKVRNIQD